MSETIAQPGQWYHIVVAAEPGQKKRLYVNGRLEALSEMKVGAPVEENAHRCYYYIGQNPDSDFYKDAGTFSGSVCEIMTFDRVLSDDEVLSLYRSSGMMAD